MTTRSKGALMMAYCKDHVSVANSYVCGDGTASLVGHVDKVDKYGSPWRVSRPKRVGTVPSDDSSDESWGWGEPVRRVPAVKPPPVPQPSPEAPVVPDVKPPPVPQPSPEAPVVPDVVVERKTRPLTRREADAVEEAGAE